MDYEAVYLPKNHFIKAEAMETEDYLALFYPFDQLEVVKPVSYTHLNRVSWGLYTVRASWQLARPARMWDN